MQIFETHAHYEDEAFDEDRREMLAEAFSAGVAKLVDVGSDIKTSRAAVELAHEYAKKDGEHPEIFAAVGIHPEYAAEYNDENLVLIRTMAADERVIAIGEIGLDYYWDSCPREKQKEAFTGQLNLAAELGKSVIIHSRDAAEDTFEILKEYALRLKAEGRPLRAVVHCYGYSKELALEYEKLGYFIGVGGVVTFKNARKLVESVESVGIDSIVVETDCPYMAPVPYRGKRNDSSKLPHIIEKIAELKGISPGDVADLTYENACRLYGLK